jgi:hypothetical protein
MERDGCVVVGSHVYMIRVALFVVHPSKRPACGVSHRRLGLPMNPIRALVEQDITEVD